MIHSSATNNQRRSQSEEQRSANNELQQLRNSNRSVSADQINRLNPASSRPTRQIRAVRAMQNAAFDYDPNNDYSMHAYIGAMSEICQYCKALKFRGETPGMCCSAGKVNLPPFQSPPDPLRSLIFENSPTSKHFMSHIREYNSAFQMTSFGASQIVRDQYMTFKVITSKGLSSLISSSNNVYFDVFKNSDPKCNIISIDIQIQGQIYHRAGSLLSFPNQDAQFMQIYFVGDDSRELDRRFALGTRRDRNGQINQITRREILSQLQSFLHQHNELVRLFKTALDRMPSDDHKIVIRADKTPLGEHARRFNAPTIDEVAIVIVGEQHLPSDIVLHRRNEQLQRVSELHRSYRLSLQNRVTQVAAISFQTTQQKS